MATREGTPPYMGPAAARDGMYRELTLRHDATDPRVQGGLRGGGPCTLTRRGDYDHHERAGALLRGRLEPARSRSTHDVHGRRLRLREHGGTRGVRDAARRPRAGARSLRASVRGLPGRALRRGPTLRGG